MNLASNVQRVAHLGEMSLRKALEAISKEEKDDKKKTAMAAQTVNEIVNNCLQNEIELPTVQNEGQARELAKK